MDTIFQLPLFFLACVQLLLALLLLSPRSIALTFAQLIKKGRKSAPANAVILTLALVLAGLLVSCFSELFRKGEQATRADTREMVSTIDYLRAQVSGVLCALNLLLLFLTRALAEALCAEDHSAKNLDAMKRQVKGLQAEYERVTKADTAKAGSAPTAGDGGAVSGGMTSEADALRKQVDRLIREKDSIQSAMDGAVKAKATAEASVVAMKSQLKGFDQHFDQILSENQLLKRKLVGYGDATYTAEVSRQQAGKKDE